MYKAITYIFYTILKRCTMENVFLNLEKEVFRGNVLDITCDGRGIIYNANKHYDSFIEIDYLENDLIERDTNSGYDSCVMFFSLQNYSTVLRRKQLFKDLHKMLNKNGYLYIWDVNKEKLKPWNGNIKVSLPDKSIVNLEIKNLNLLEDSTSYKVIDSIKEYFEVIEKIESNNCFKIVAKRKDD